MKKNILQFDNYDKGYILDKSESYEENETDILFEGISLNNLKTKDIQNINKIKEIILNKQLNNETLSKKFNVPAKQIETIKNKLHKQYAKLDVLKGFYVLKKNKKYCINLSGDVLNIKNRTFLKKSINCRGYYTIGIGGYNKGHSTTLHRILATQFLPNPNNKPCINHKDGDQKNNNITNLEWVTQKENVDHAWNNNLNKNKGETHYLSKLSNKDVLEIYNGKGQKTSTELSKIYNISPREVRHIWTGACWRHITGKVK